ncbi:type II CAAX endopeptidase family protein [Hydrocarboniclastica marina]|uniref:CPBP family intramembrane metalloprotease n=1 Tax=Hydrocarboniclastica marina TaxID=2259620 RepID=A0A4P7XHC4_9ALTE|nr:type II CAAX endopeptidase family protein [Hydrocarboniclastica marina]QCF26155.1 CPBP family intramembrane metalloprotease [Hydrocarboniclastica marina]
MIPEHPEEDGIGLSALIPFVLITFLITWSITGFYIFFNELAVALLGQISGTHPLFFLAVWAPAIAAVAVIFHRRGATGLKLYLRRLRVWRIPAGWLLFILIGIPGIFFLGALIKGAPLQASVISDGISAVLPVMVIMLLLGPVEELGWRGLALPVLQRHMAPVWAAILIGAVWGLWHLPAFYLSGVVHSGWGFAPFFIGNICLSVIVTPIFNRTGGSILWPMLYHFQLSNPLWPDAQPYDTYLLIGVSVLILIFRREAMFSNKHAYTAVIPSTIHSKAST